MRTFIAIDLSDDNKAELTKLQEELKSSNADVKWVEPDNIHLTLKFLGEISDEQSNQIKQALDKIASGSRPFELSLSGIGAFPKLDYPRVIWVGIEKGKNEVETIAKNIEDALCRAHGPATAPLQGFPKEDRPFSAHLTIGRVKSAKNKDVLKKQIETLNLSPLPFHLQQVTSLILYQSTLTPKGPIYTPLQVVRFPC